MQSNMGSVGIVVMLDSFLLQIAVKFGKVSCEVTHQYFRGHLVLSVSDFTLNVFVLKFISCVWLPGSRKDTGSSFHFHV